VVLECEGTDVVVVVALVVGVADPLGDEQPAARARVVTRQPRTAVRADGGPTRAGLKS
jgi:hypothetical protein